MNENFHWIAVSKSFLDRPATYRTLSLYRAMREVNERVSAVSCNVSFAHFIQSAGWFYLMGIVCRWLWTGSTSRQGDPGYSHTCFTAPYQIWTASRLCTHEWAVSSELMVSQQNQSSNGPELWEQVWYGKVNNLVVVNQCWKCRCLMLIYMIRWVLTS